jgi:hypothetical protein
MSANGSLRNSLSTIVGYGATDTVFGGGAPDANEGEGTRRFATEGFLALNQNLIKLNQNTVFGYGGSSHGDSGGPTFLGAGSGGSSLLVAITIGGDPWGIEQNVAYRLDTPQARAFLGQFVPLPCRESAPSGSHRERLRSRPPSFSNSTRYFGSMDFNPAFL